MTPDSGERHFQNHSSYALKNLIALNAINLVVGATMEYRIKGHDSILKHPLVWRLSGIIIRPLNKLECWELRNLPCFTASSYSLSDICQEFSVEVLTPKTSECGCISK